MSEFTINRPVATVHVMQGGVKYTYSVTAPTWSNEYIRTQSFNNKKLAEKASNNFLDLFNKDADAIESSGRQLNIMAGQVQHQRFVSRKKLTNALSNGKY
jgi:hypothetical protein